MSRFSEAWDALDPPLRRFWVFNIATLSSALVTLGTAWLFGFRHTEVVEDLGVMLLALVTMLFSVLFVPRWGARAVVLGLVLGSGAFAFGGTWVTPYLAPATVLLLLIPVLVAFPYLGLRGVRLLVAYAVVGCTSLGAIAEHRRDDDLVSTIVVGATIPFMVVVVAFAVWESHQRMRRQARELRRSRTRLVEVADAARRSLERDLHDGAQQRLVAMSVRIAQARLAADAGDTEQVRDMLSELSAENLLALAELRELARGIYPPLLAERGLVPAVQSISRRSLVPVVLHAGEVPRQTRQVESAAYFCILEALQNVAKHAEATEVVLDLHADPDVVFSVRDDGRGFSPETAGQGDGMMGMEARISAVGGTLSVVSAPGQGTLVAGRLPAQPL